MRTQYPTINASVHPSLQLIRLIFSTVSKHRMYKRLIMLIINIFGSPRQIVKLLDTHLNKQIAMALEFEDSMTHRLAEYVIIPT